MIVHLEGELTYLLPTLAHVDVSGVGYELNIPLSTYDRLPVPPAKTRILTHLVVREDAHTLYGFASNDERDLFRLLIDKVNGVGPRVALAILSGISVADFRNYVVSNDVASLAKVKGLGKKTAEKIVLELRDKIGVSAAWAASAEGAASPADNIINDAVLALIALGYKQADALNAVRAAKQATPDLQTEELIRTALRSL